MTLTDAKREALTEIHNHAAFRAVATALAAESSGRLLLKHAEQYLQDASDALGWRFVARASAAAVRLDRWLETSANAWRAVTSPAESDPLYDPRESYEAPAVIGDEPLAASRPRL